MTDICHGKEWNLCETGASHGMERGPCAWHLRISQLEAPLMCPAGSCCCVLPWLLQLDSTLQTVQTHTLQAQNLKHQSPLLA